MRHSLRPPLGLNQTVKMISTVSTDVTLYAVALPIDRCKSVTKLNFHLKIHDSRCHLFSSSLDLTLSRSLTSRTCRAMLGAPHNLPTLGAILKAEPLKPPPPHRKLSDLRQETQDDDDIAIQGPDDLSKDESLRIGEKANRCCVPQFAWAISCNGRRQHK